MSKMSCEAAESVEKDKKAKGAHFICFCEWRG